MIKRFLIAILSIIITALKFVVNMLTIGISFLTKKEIPLVDDWTPNDNSDERQEAFERQKYVVEHSPYGDSFEEELPFNYDSPIKF